MRLIRAHAPALERFLNELSSTGFTITFSHQHVPARLPTELTLCLFRIAQEALQNAARHSRAGAVSVDLARPTGTQLRPDGCRRRRWVRRRHRAVGTRSDQHEGTCGTVCRLAADSLEPRLQAPTWGSVVPVRARRRRWRRNRRMTPPGNSRRVLLVGDPQRHSRPRERDAASRAATSMAGAVNDGPAAHQGGQPACVPDVVVLDISMPSMSGFEVAKRLLKSASTPVIVCLTVNDDEDFVPAPQAAGGVGFVVKRRLGLRCCPRPSRKPSPAGRVCPTCGEPAPWRQSP